MADQPYAGPEIEAAVRILREDAQLQHNRRLMERLDAMEERLGRMPVQELSAEEKAAAYDRLMAEQKQGKPGTPPGTPGAPPPAGEKDPAAPPPAPAPKMPTPPPTTTTRKAWWDGYQSQGG
jgi:hypothetical protein